MDTASVVEEAQPLETRGVQGMGHVICTLVFVSFSICRGSFFEPNFLPFMSSQASLNFLMISLLLRPSRLFM